MREKTIAHIIFSLTTGGAENLLIDIINVQVSRARVSLFVINDHFEQALIDRLDKRASVCLIKRPAGSRSFFDFIRLNYKLWRQSYDVLHLHNHDLLPFLIPSLRRIACLTVHELGVVSTYFNRVSRLFSISNAVHNDVLIRCGRHSKLISNGIQMSSISRKAYNNKPKPVLRCVIIGRLDHAIKGQDVAIKAVYSLKQKGINHLRLDLIGEGGSREYLETLVEELNLESEVKLLGLKERSFIQEHLCQYDLLIQPSRLEGFGLTVVEAMAANIPVMVSNIGGPMEVIRNGQYGYYFDAGSSESLAEGLENLGPLLMGGNVLKSTLDAYDFANKTYSITQTALSYLDEY